MRKAFVAVLNGIAWSLGAFAVYSLIPMVLYDLHYGIGGPDSGAIFIRSQDPEAVADPSVHVTTVRPRFLNALLLSPRTCDLPLPPVDARHMRPG